MPLQIEDLCLRVMAEDPARYVGLSNASIVQNMNGRESLAGVVEVSMPCFCANIVSQACLFHCMPLVMVVQMTNIKTCRAMDQALQYIHAGSCMICCCIPHAL